MPPFDLVIFDCDGVLLDSEIIACGADAEAFTNIGYEITAMDVCTRFAGMSSETVYAEIAAEMGRPLPFDLRNTVRTAIFEKYRTELEPIAGAKELLSSLTLPKCIASSSSPAKLALGLVETDLFELMYPHIFSTSLVERGKPAPDIFLFAAEKMGVPPAKCVVIEDSVAGVTAAKLAGMTCIGFTGGSHCLEGHHLHLKEAGADMVVGALDEVRSLVE